MGKPDIYIVEVRRKGDNSFLGYLKYHKNRSRDFVYDEYLGLRVGISYTIARIVSLAGARRCISYVEPEYKKIYKFRPVLLSDHIEEYFTRDQRRKHR